MGKKLLLIGGGGHCRSVMDSVKAAGEYDTFGVIDNRPDADGGAPVIGTDADIPRLMAEGWTDAVITVGSVGDTSVRRRLCAAAKKAGLHLPVIIDPTAVIADDAEIGEGTFIGKRAIVNTGSRIGACAIINSGAIVEHDCMIGDAAHISTGAVLCGQVRIGDGAHIGAGTTVRQCVRIGERTVVGIGSVVVKDLPADVKAYGNPCRVAER